MQIENVKVSSLKPYEKNAKKHPKEQIEFIANSIRDFGFRQPLVIDKDNVLVIGHGRLAAAKKLGIKEIPCVRADDLTDEQIKALRLADNKTNESEWDLELLNVEIDDIIDIDMSQFGFDVSADFEDEEPITTMEDELPEDDEVETRCKLGDIWQLGEHRLICGDSTSAENVALLMDGAKAKMLFTSPPYSDIREYNGDKDLSVSNIVNFISAFRPYTDYQCVNLGIQRKNHEIVQYWDEYIEKARECGYKLMAWNVWDKTMAGSIGQQSAFFPIRHEWIFVFGTEFFEINETWEKKEASITDNGGQRKVRQKDGTTTYSTKGDTSHKYKQMESVVSICSECGAIRALHPATFPVGLPAEYVKAMTDEGDIVIEPFGGSGTTMIACEQLNRKCYMSELDERYCDVIIQRWENFTGKKAVKING